MASSVMSGEEFERLKEIVASWVDKHPIEGKLFVRPTARADLATLVSHEDHGGLKAVGSMEETLRDMGDRITILTVQTPVEVRLARRVPGGVAIRGPRTRSHRFDGSIR